MWSNSWQVNTDLAPGEAVVLTTTVEGAGALGERTFTATADTTAAVDERDEDNNSLAEITPVATMDLVPTLTRFDSTYTPGSPYNATIRVTNNSSISSSATTLSIYMLDSVSPAVLQTWPALPVQALAFGAFVDIETTVVISMGSTVDRYLVYAVDDDYLIEENDEDNNTVAITLLPL